MKRRRVCRGDDILLEGGANKRIHLKSQPLIKFLETLRSHKHGSPFITRLPSQETEKYQRLVRQHMDLDTVEYRFQKGDYDDCHSKFYRDLLLIFTNAVIFYRKSSAEHMAARELRKLVLDEIALRTRKPNDDETRPTKPSPEIQHLDPVVKKPRSSSTFSMVACRRNRSSTSTQALSDSMKSNEKDDPSRANSSSNGVVTRSKEKDNSDKLVAKQGGLKVMGDNVGSGVDGRGRTKNVKAEAKHSVSEDDKKRDEGRSESEEDEALEMTRKKRSGGGEQKKGMTTRFNKQGVANFLKRIKQNSPSSQEKKGKVIKNEVEDEEEEEEEEEEKEDEEEEGERERERERRTKMRNDRNNNDDNSSSKGKKMRSDQNGNKRSNTNGDESKKEKVTTGTGKNVNQPNKRLLRGSSPDNMKGGGRRSLRSNGGESSRRARSRR